MLKTGKVKWTLERIKKGYEDFYNERGHYPTATEIDSYGKLPSSRQIQRVYGGLPLLREKINLKAEHDLTKGKHSSERAVMIGKRAHKVELEVYTYLSLRFEKSFINRKYSFSDNNKNQIDFYMVHKKGNFLIDVFYPSDKKNLIGCLNSKLSNYAKLMTDGTPIIYLMMNRDIGENDIEKIISNELPRSKLPRYQCLR
ncbi:MAG: hypothetical protein Q7R78_02755 [bacterium]|nr:hypothetical protein [bacterium]